MTQKKIEKTVFIAMPFGERTGFLHHSEEDPSKRKTIKFDSVWKGIVEKSLPDGVIAVRADDLRSPGIIDRKYMRLLLEADVVVADLTFANPNVYYEVGIRQALRRAGTVLIACDGTILPFDLRNQTVHYYPYEEAPSIDDFRDVLKDAIESAIFTEDVHSPVHVFLPELKGALENSEPNTVSSSKVENFFAKLQNETSRAGVLRLTHPILKLKNPSVALLENLGIKLRKVGEFDLALEALEKAMNLDPSDTEVIREIGFCYRKKGPAFYDEAESFLKEAIEKNPYDFDALGMLGGLAKRRGDYSEALSHYSAAHDIEPSELYPLVTLGAIHALLGNNNKSHDYYMNCLSKAEGELENDSTNYWAHMCKGEAITVQGNSKGAIESYKLAIDAKVPKEDLVSAMEQLQLLAAAGIATATCNEVIEIINTHKPN